MTVAYEHEMNYRHVWEFFANGYLQWTECASCDHVCPESFWRNYRTYGFGVAYKPCVVRGRNHLRKLTHRRFGRQRYESNSLPDCILVTSIITCYAPVGHCTGR